MPKYLTKYGFHELFLYITRTHVVFKGRRCISCRQWSDQNWNR